MPIIINSEASLQEFIGEVRQVYAKHHYFKATLKTGKDRSLDQNAIGHVWYSQIARELREDDAKGWKRYCKLHLGVPILRASEDDSFRKFYDAGMRGMQYEDKLSAMDFVPVTSIMTVEQEDEYLRAMQSEFRARGVMLEFPLDCSAKQ